MYIDYLSDIHADFHVPFNKNQTKWKQRTYDFADQLILNSYTRTQVLVIAGDLSHYNIQSKWIVDRLALYYPKVLIVLGNHDYYLITMNQADKYNMKSENRVIDLKILLENNPKVKVLDDELFKYKDVTFYGSTMWYPLDTIERQRFFTGISNDSQLIYRMNIYDKHEEQINNYYQIIDKVDVMISHVPLIHINSHDKQNSTYCYLTPVTKLAPYTIFGHCHEQNNYWFDGKQQFINALGYDDDNLSLTIKSFKFEFRQILILGINNRSEYMMYPTKETWYIETSSNDI